MKVLVTGATGFIGRSLAYALPGADYEVVLSARRVDQPGIMVGDLSERTDWRKALEGCHAVIHLAGLAHQQPNTRSDNPLQRFLRVNKAGTMRLAEQAREVGVRRFVFLSSIKANGAERFAPYREADLPKPTDPYGLSKFEAERELWRISENSSMEVVVVRPPLVYGAGAKANFLRLMKLLASGLPLPFGCVKDNRRSFVAIDNLVDFLVTCIRDERAANKTFLISDGEDLSTADLISRLARAMGKPARLFPLPPGIIRSLTDLVGRPDISDRLLGNLSVDITYARTTLNWGPVVDVDEGLRRAVRGFKL